MTQLFEKRGRRYIPWGHGEHWGTYHDAMPIGSFRVISCPAPGHYRTTTDVTPDTAAFLAAASIARDAMEAALLEKARATPSAPTLYTPRQRELIEQFQRDMAEAGALIPTYWNHSTPFEIAQAGIDAVSRWAS